MEVDDKPYCNCLLWLDNKNCLILREKYRDFISNFYHIIEEKLNTLMVILVV